MATDADTGARVGVDGPLGAPGATVRGHRAPPMRSVKLAIAAAFRDDGAVAALVPGSQIFATERASVPKLPSVEAIGVSSERVGGGPIVRHELSIEVTISSATEDGADEALDRIVKAVRLRLGDAETSERPIALPSGESVVVVVGATRWSLSASATAGVIRGASVALDAAVAE